MISVSKLTVGELFAGVGGFSCGLERTGGFETRWQVEIDDYCNEVLKRHWPNVARFKEVRDVGRHNLEPVDVVCGGFPCQPFSVAGKQRGAKDDRYLWPEMLRIIEELRPTWVIGENVFGLASMVQYDSEPPVDGDGFALGEVGDTFNRLGRGILKQIVDSVEALGYKVQPLVIPACGVNAPHRRDRVWIVGHTEHARHPRPEKAGDFGQGGVGSTAGKKQAGQPARPDSGEGGPAGVERSTTDASGERKREPADQTNSVAISRQTRKISSGSNGRQALADAGCQRQTECQKQATGAEQCNGRQALADVRKLDDGLSPDMVPDWAGGTWTMPEPLVYGKQPGRAAILKALGNAVCVPVVTEIGKMILRAHNDIS